MLRTISRLFTIRSRFDAYLIIYALALGATRRGMAYVREYPGWGGRLLFIACCASVLIAGAKILDCVRLERATRRGMADGACDPGNPEGKAAGR